MPWSQSYRCLDGHEFEYLHMGPRETCPQFIPCEGSEVACGRLAEKSVSTPFLKTIVRGNHDFAEREKSRLTAQSQEHWKREGRHEAVDRIRMRRKKDVIG